MNYLFFSKKLSVFSSYLNLLSSLGWIFLIFSMGYYHLYLINDLPKGYYYSFLPNKSFIADVFSNLRQRTPVTSIQPTPSYASSFINGHGHELFFSQEINLFNKAIKFWTLVQPVFIFSIISSSLNLGISLLTSFLSFKARSFNYLVISLANLFIPIYGFWLTFKINNKMNDFKDANLNIKKIISPGQWVKFKSKLLFSKIFSDMTVPT
ncbi:hypothetical protein [Mycoplasma parvum]|uniref:Uncharacterized protein n=1 Tax=Mycoplasma parvum str. Indiana TaxID=1403316 RepID=U5ND50_9MOLU|nr:hypothetical protein [Mycoplasma parvum]AGX89327.1 hypothetical protein PRV_03010 [Mycoplasma parvum str. Indiana]